ncbi:MAG: HD domain-containing phosphohydrolase [Gemmatimonadota bacterium]
MGKTGAESGTASAVALLSGDPELDRVTGEALARIDPRFRAAEDPRTILELARDAAVGLILCDAENPAVDPIAFARELIRQRPTPPLLLVLCSPESTSSLATANPAIEHYLCRPFRAETLAALGRSLLDSEARVARLEEDGSVPLRVRRPARFSLRPLYGNATRHIESVYERAREGKAPEPTELRLWAERIHSSLLQSNMLLVRVLEPYARFELPVHSVNVAILSGRLSQALEWGVQEALRAIQAGLVHDIGMMLLPERILRAEGPLSPQDREEMQQHPHLGADLLDSLGDQFEWLRRAVREEHERWRGQGYPAGLRGDEIDRTARILGVADVFEAFAHARDYRSPFTAFEALERVVSMRDEYLEREIVDALANEISVFPPDSYVLLDTGEIARVIDTNPDNLMRPTVEVLWDSGWSPRERVERIPLEERPELTIVRPLHESEVPIT